MIGGGGGGEVMRGVGGVSVITRSSSTHACGDSEGE